MPPERLLDEALEHGLWVQVGIPWEQHVAFLDERGRARAIEARVRDGVARCAEHPAVLCFAVGNEVPAPIVRWSGGARVERHIRRLYDAAKEVYPEALVTYVNFPTAEYLNLRFSTCSSTTSISSRLVGSARTSLVCTTRPGIGP